MQIKKGNNKKANQGNISSRAKKESENAIFFKKVST